MIEKGKTGTHTAAVKLKMRGVTIGAPGDGVARVDGGEAAVAERGAGGGVVERERGAGGSVERHLAVSSAEGGGVFFTKNRGGMPK